MPRDIFDYFKFKRYNETPYFGKIITRCALPGGGKTLSTTLDIVEAYKRYQDKLIFVEIEEDGEKKNVWCKQKIDVYSNVALDIPYIKFESMQQFMDVLHKPANVVSWFFIDEASITFNSRQFKSNFNTNSLNTLLTLRHHKACLWTTSQRFSFEDILLRQMTNSVYECKFYKWCRVLIEKEYDAYELENCTNPLLLKPISKRYRFITDEDYDHYDTYAMVEDISKKAEAGDLMSDQEVLELRGEVYTSLDQVSNPSRKLKKRWFMK